MEFVEVARITDIDNGRMKSVQAEGKEVLVVNIDNQYFAIGGKCTHMGADLASGKLEGKIVTCPKHGAQFDVTTGSCVKGPKMGPFKLKAKDAVAYEVKVEGESVQVKL
jgi:3-phenylpropionate/trans-cinnamate dioxygenase ferredoxin component